MAKMKLTFDQTENLFCEIEAGEEYDGFKVVEKTDWDGGDKYQYMDIIFEHSGKTWSMGISRSGSYFSDYYYGFRESNTGETATEVEKKEVITHKWVAVKDEGQ